MYSPTTLAGNTSNSPTRDAPIPAQVLSLRNASERLHQALNVLLERIAPTLGAAPESPSTNKAASGFSGNSPLGSELCAINENILSAIYRLQHAADAVEL